MKTPENYLKFNQLIREYRNDTKILCEVFRERIGTSGIMLVTMFPEANETRYSENLSQRERNKLKKLADKMLEGKKFGQDCLHFIFEGVPLKWSGNDPAQSFDENRKIMQVTKKLDKARR